MEKVAKGVDDIGLAELVLNECHDMGQVGLADILTVHDLGHDGRKGIRGDGSPVTFNFGSA